jgi:Ras family
VLQDGRFSVDGFLCLFDVSTVPSRSVERQVPSTKTFKLNCAKQHCFSKVEFLAGILNNLIKTKKPVVLVTTKNDEANEVYVKEAERLVQRKEFKGTVMMVETSAHENINIDQAFITLAQMIDRTKGRPKVISRLKKQCLLKLTRFFSRLCRSERRPVIAKSSWTRHQRRSSGWCGTRCRISTASGATRPKSCPAILTLRNTSPFWA